MNICIDDARYARLCKLADERNTTPAALARLWVERLIDLQWAKREPSIMAMAEPERQKEA